MNLDEDIDWGALKRNPYKRQDKLTQEELIDLIKYAWDGMIWENQVISDQRKRNIKRIINNSEKS